MKWFELIFILFFVIAGPLLSPATSASGLPDNTPVPGGIAVVELPASDTLPRVRYNGKPVMVLASDSTYSAIVGLPLAAKPGTHTLKIEYAGGESATLDFTVLEKTYSSQHITLENKRMVNPEKRDMERIGRE